MELAGAGATRSSFALDCPDPRPEPGCGLAGGPLSMTRPHWDFNAGLLEVGLTEELVWPLWQKGEGMGSLSWTGAGLENP